VAAEDPQAVTVPAALAAAPVRVSDPGPGLELSVVVVQPAAAPLAAAFRPAVSDALAALGCAAEVVVVTEPGDVAAAASAWPGADVVAAPAPGYGTALVHGLRRAQGEWVLLLDADLRAPADAIARLWAARDRGEIVIGSRFVDGATVREPALRHGLSRALNKVFGRGLSLGVRDLSSATRLVRRKTLAAQYDARGYDILQELLVRAYADGWRVVEVPIDYEPERPGAAYPRALGVGADYVRRFWALWKLRNSILAADYDDRAHDSAIWLQRYWQRQRFKHITELVNGEGRVLDVGCGSSRIIGALVKNSVCIDILRRKLRYDRKFGRPLVHGSAFTLPVPDASFPCVLCSQVIEHVPKESPILKELDRALAPGGRLVLGTPDYSRWEWVVTEKLYGMAAPGAYADEHIGHYTREELIARYTGMGWTHEATRYILRGELILAFRKPRA
jgi:SAM-dependent methyltransferase